MDLIVLGIVWRLDLNCRRASGHVALGSDVDHSCMPTGMRELSLPQASTEVRVFGSVGSAQHIRDHSSVTRFKL